MKKSYLFSFLLTLFFGPIGLFYSSVAAALALTLIAIGVGSFTLGIGFLATWPVAMLIGFFTVRRHNKLVGLENKRHDELVKATRENAVVKQ